MTQQAGERVASGPAAGRDARHATKREWFKLTRDWLRSNLFLKTEGSIGWRKFVAAVVFVVAGTVVSLTRTTGPGALNTVWIEDARNLLSGALTHPFSQNITTSTGGYYESTGRVLAQIAVHFPLTWAAGAMSVFAAAQYAIFGLIAYIASGPHLYSPCLRLLIAVPVFMIPLGYTQANNDLVTTQFFMLFGVFWVLLWIPRTLAGRIVGPIVMLSVASSTVLTIFLAPLVVARLIVDRSKSAVIMVFFWIAGFALEMLPSLNGQTNRFQWGVNSPLWALKNYATRAVPRALFGEKALGGPGTTVNGYVAPLHITSVVGHDALIAAAWTVVLIALLLALARRTHPNWPLAVTAALFSFLLFAGQLFINHHVVQPRYVIAPALLLYTAFVASLRPHGVAARERGSRPMGIMAALGWIPVGGFAVVLAVAVALNFRVVNGRTDSPTWTSAVAQARAACADGGAGLSDKAFTRSPSGKGIYWFRYSWWSVEIPCHRVSRPSA